MIDLVHDGAARVLEGPLAVRNARFSCMRVRWYSESKRVNEGGTFTDG